MSDNVIEIDIVSDVMCPWCYIGKRRLEKAIKELPGDIELAITWHPFQLDPTIPPEGRDRQTYLRTKFGGEQGAKDAYEPVVDAGKAEEIPFDFDGIKLSPNTLNAHRVLHWAKAYNLQDEVSEALFKAYFTEGRDLTSNDVLADVAAEAGLEREVIERLLASDTDVDEIKQELDHFRQMGVSSVPTMIVGRKYAVMGAQPPETLVEVITAVREERKLEEQQA